jgi:hypothetical protein
VKIEVFFIVKTYPNGRSKIEAGPFYSHMDALIYREERIFHPLDNDYRIAMTELEMELV